MAACVSAGARSGARARIRAPGGGRRAAGPRRAKPIGTRRSRRPQTNSDGAAARGAAARSPARRVAPRDRSGGPPRRTQRARRVQKARRNSSTPAASSLVGARDETMDDRPRPPVAARTGSAPVPAGSGAAAAPTGGRVATPSTEPEGPGARRDRDGAGRPRAPPDRPGCCRPMWAIDLQRVEQVDDRAGEVRRVVRAGGLVGVAEARKVRAITRNSPASAATVGRKDPFVPPSPWTGRTGGPLRPPVEIRPGASRRAEPQPVRARHAARRGQEAHPEVQVAADRQAARTIGVHTASQIAGHPITRRGRR